MCKRNLLGKPYTTIAGALRCAAGGCSMNGSGGESEAAAAATPIAPTTAATAGRVRFAFRPPQPPPNRMPPPPPLRSAADDAALNVTPPENVYETVEPSVSSVVATRPTIVQQARARQRGDELGANYDDDEYDDDNGRGESGGRFEMPTVNGARVRPRRSLHRRDRRVHRRSLSVDGDTPRFTAATAAATIVGDATVAGLKPPPHAKRLVDGACRVPPQNFYSRMPPECRRPTSSNYATTSTSESDSDDDIYVNTAMAAIVATPPPAHLADAAATPLAHSNNRVARHVPPPRTPGSQRTPLAAAAAAAASLTPTNGRGGGGGGAQRRPASLRGGLKKSNANCFIS